MFCWKVAGKPVDIHQLSYKHLVNAINFCIRRNSAFLPLFIEEYERRAHEDVTSRTRTCFPCNTNGLDSKMIIHFRGETIDNNGELTRTYIYMFICPECGNTSHPFHRTVKTIQDFVNDKRRN